MTRHARRGSAPVLTLCLYLALTSILLGAVALAGASSAAAEREYRRSQALALAEAALAEARAGGEPHGPRPFGTGTYAWDGEPEAGGARLVTARAEVVAVSGARVTRTVRARMVRQAGEWTVASWEEGP